MANASGGSSSRFEHDLRAIREARSVRLADVQQDTRIPADVLDRFETGRLVGDPHYNEVYLKNLLRAYANAIGMTPSEVVAAYDAQKAGKYEGELRRHITPEGSQSPRRHAEEAQPPAEGQARPAEPPAEKSRSRRGKKAETEKPRPAETTEPETAVPPAAAAPPAVAALRKPERRPTEPAAPKSEPKARVRSRESVTSSTSSIESSWGLIIGGTLVAILVIGGALWLMLRPEPIEVVNDAGQVAVAPDDEDTVDDDDAVDDPPAGDAPQLQTPIQVTVIAEGGALGGAGGFRVTEAPDVRRPYWLEQGEEQTFTSDSAVVLWGTGADEQFGIPAEARLRMQGFTWDPPTGAVLQIDRQRGQAILDSLHRAQGRPGS